MTDEEKIDRLTLAVARAAPSFQSWLNRSEDEAAAYAAVKQHAAAFAETNPGRTHVLDTWRAQALEAAREFTLIALEDLAAPHPPP